MKDVVVYSSDLEALKTQLKANGHYIEGSDTYSINHTLTPVIKKGILSLSYVRSFCLDIEDYHMLEILGSYEEIFADTQKDDLYKSVYPYHIEQFYEDENGNQVGYYLPKKIGDFL